jgi:phosphoglycerate dehydrogenase-like enzyme
MHRPEALDDLLPRADFVIATVPHTPGTEFLFDAPRFARMRKGAFFINIGRGMTTRLSALDAALRSGHLGGPRSMCTRWSRCRRSIRCGRRRT